MTSSNPLAPQITHKHWQPIPEVSASVESFCNRNSFTNILEIGPGIVQFPLATQFVGCNESITDYIDMDLDVDKLPFEDKSLDFVYCRHTLEDIQNPDFVMREIIRVSNSGYIETPSPMVEITKGVDGLELTSQYAGYIHHRYIVWGDIEKCEIHFLPKYSAIIDNFIVRNNNQITDMLNSGPFPWNNYFIWNGQTPKIIMHKIVVNIRSDHFIEDYCNLLQESVNTCCRNNQYFYDIYLKPSLRK